ncbi:hypothetical protein ACW9YQ_14470 (plasmid) [Paraburkholderia strydomiana]
MELTAEVVHPGRSPVAFAPPGENPVLPSIRTFKDEREARAALEHLPDFESRDNSSSDARLLVPGVAHGRLMEQLLRCIYESAEERNLACEEFRNGVLTAHQFLHYLKNRHAHSTPPVQVALPNAQPRGLFAVVPHGLGQFALRYALQQYVGSGVRTFDFGSNDGSIRFFRLDSLVVPFPTNGSLPTLVNTAARLIDGIFKTGFKAKGTGPLHRNDEEATLALQALALSTNLGPLIVEQANTSNTRSTRAAHVWSALSQFTIATGIPVLCIATPGAAASLVNHSGAQPALSIRGTYSIEPYAPQSKEWENVAFMLWLKYLATLSTSVPEWFAMKLWQVTHGRIELAVKVCTHIAKDSKSKKRSPLVADELERRASEALAMEIPYLRAMVRASRGGTFTRGAVKRFADWLPFDMVMRSIASLDETDDPFAESLYPSLSASRRDASSVIPVEEVKRVEHESAGNVRAVENGVKS